MRANPDLELVERVLSAVTQSTGLAARLAKAAPVAGFVSGAKISGWPLKVAAKGKVDRVVTVSEMHTRLSRVDRRSDSGTTLLATEFLSPTMLEACRSLRFNAADASGNAYLEWDGLFVFVSGRPRRERTQQRLGWTPAAIHVGLLALAQPRLLGASHRAIAASAGIALGSVGPTLEWFHERGFITGSKTERIIRRPDELLAEWTIAYSTRLRPRLHSQKFAWPTGQPRWWKATEIEPATWSGEVGTAMLLGHLKPNTAEIYVATDNRPAVLRRMVKEQRLVPDTDGSIDILDQFWNFELGADQHVAPWPVLYADLLRVGDPRLSEAAALIRAKFV
jgi:hypothetical protein